VYTRRERVRQGRAEERRRGGGEEKKESGVKGEGTT